MNLGKPRRRLRVAQRPSVDIPFDADAPARGEDASDRQHPRLTPAPAPTPRAERDGEPARDRADD